MPYFGLYVPSKAKTPGKVDGAADGANESPGGESETPSTWSDSIKRFATPDQKKEDFVFSSKSQALSSLKKYKDARLRKFPTMEDAQQYAETGYEVLATKYDDTKTSTVAVEKAVFKAPPRYKLSQFRNFIDEDCCKDVELCIWENPRYLVSACDTPTILKEGFRYNAMHFCAISDRPKIAKLILDTISDVRFTGLLIGENGDEKACKELSANLLDYYLNIPEKRCGETPLHLASKFGRIAMVELLLSYPQCKILPNYNGRLPQQIAGARTASLHSMRISELFNQFFYVPVLRTMDGTTPPHVGEPFSFYRPPSWNGDGNTPEVKIQALAGPMDKEKADKFFRRWKTPPRINSNRTASPLSGKNLYITPVKMRPVQSVCAASTPCGSTPVGLNCSGGASPVVLQRRKLFSNSLPLQHSAPDLQILDYAMADDRKISDATDKENGNPAFLGDDLDGWFLDDNHNNNNNNNDDADKDSRDDNGGGVVGMRPKLVLCPSTPLMRAKKNAFFQYRDPVVVSPVKFNDSCSSNRNEAFGGIGERFTNSYVDSPGFMERHIKNTDTEKGLEIIGRALATEQYVNWSEYWDFLDSFADFDSADGLKKFEEYLEKRFKETEEAKTEAQPKAFIGQAIDSKVTLNEVCNVLKKFSLSLNGGDTGRMDYDTPPIDGITTSSPSIVPTTLLATPPATPFMCVEKSLQVFAKRITKTIRNNVDPVVSINLTLQWELKRLKSLIVSFKDDERFASVLFLKVHSRIANLIAYYLRESQEVNGGQPDSMPKIEKILRELLTLSGERSGHIDCLSSKILERLTKEADPNSLPDQLKTEVMCRATWFREEECECQWEKNLSRQTSRRSRGEGGRLKSTQRAKEMKTEMPASHIKSADVVDTPATNPTPDNPAKVENDGTDSDEAGDDIFWSDSDAYSDFDDQDDDVWVTPHETMIPNGSLESLVDEQPQPKAYNLFIFGSMPTKRDVDVLNAISKSELSCAALTRVTAWLDAMSQYTREEMLSFPSPVLAKKSLLTQVSSMPNLMASEGLAHQATNAAPSPTIASIPLAVSTPVTVKDVPPNQSLPFRLSAILTQSTKEYSTDSSLATAKK